MQPIDLIKWLDEEELPPNMARGRTADAPFRIRFEIQNLIAVHSRELVCQNKSTGASKPLQESIMEKGFHGYSNHVSLLSTFMGGKAPYSGLFNFLPLENNRPGNDLRDGNMLELKQAFHKHYDLSLIVHENITTENIGIVRNARLGGRNLKDRFDNCAAMYKHALVYAKEFLDDDGNHPSGKGHEDLLDYVRRKMYCHCRGSVDVKSMKKEAPPVEEDDCPPDYLFNGFLCFAVFGPKGLSGMELACLTDDGKKVPRKGRAALRKEEARQKELDRRAGVGGHVPKEHARGVPLNAKATMAQMASRDEIDRRTSVREQLFMTEKADENGWNRHWKMGDKIEKLENVQEITVTQLEELEFLKGEYNALRKILVENRKRKSNLNDRAMKMLDAPNKRQITAFEEQLGNFNTPVQVSEVTASDVRTPASSITSSSRQTAAAVANQVVDSLTAPDSTTSPQVLGGTPLSSDADSDDSD